MNLLFVHYKPSENLNRKLIFFEMVEIAKHN